MKLLFLLKEGFAGFRRARLAVTIALTTTTLSLALLGLFGLVAQNLSDSFQRIFYQIRLEVFVDPSLGESDLQTLKSEIERIEAVQSAEYISPGAALQEFEKDFGKELVTILESNPLPPSFRVVLKTGRSRPEVIQAVVRRIEALKAVDEVVYPENLIRLLNKYFLLGVVIAAGLGAAIFIISTLLIFNTIRLAIHSRQRVIEIMRLVGATDAFIKAPFIFEGILQGLIGGLLAAGLLWLAGDLLRYLFLPDLVVPSLYLAGLVVTGILLGFIGSYLSVGKYLNP